MIRRSLATVIASVSLSTQTWAATIDRQAFLEAVKERLKSEPALMTSIPGLSLPSSGDNASFGIELRIPIPSGPGDALVDLVGRDENRLSFEIDGPLTSVGQKSFVPTTHPVTQASSDSGGWFMIGIFVLVGVGLAFFCIPTMVAFSRRHRSRWTIMVVNLAFGATLIGWVIALIWALNKVDDPVKGGVKLGPLPPDPIL